MIIPALWERNCRLVKGKAFAPKAVVHIDANISPNDIKLEGANESKIKFIASGSLPLKHPRKLHLTREMEEAAKLLRKYLPVLIGLGLQCFLPQIEPEELLAYDGILKVDDDEREGQ